MLRDISAWHVLLLLIVFIVLFGYKKLPDATRSVGRSMRILKSEVRGLHDDEPHKAEPRSGVRVEPVAPVETAETVDRPSVPPAPVQPVRISTDTHSDADRT